jgi:putative addiction module component (TIGR02574 family)
MGAMILDFDFSQLTVAARFSIMRRICDSLENDLDSFQPTAEEWAEYDRRAQEAMDRPEKMLTLEEFKARLEQMK